MYYFQEITFQLCILKAKQGGKVSSLTTKTTITDIAVSVLNIAYYTS